MWALLTALPGVLKGLFGTVNHVTDAISNEKIAVVNAKTEEERIAAQERVNTLTMKRDVMIAEAATSKINIRMRAALACCVLVILAKILIWDHSVGPFYGCVGKLEGAAAKACAAFTTDALGSDIWQVIMVVIGFYFLSEVATFFKRK
jgi:hypothetical protein